MLFRSTCTVQASKAASSGYNSTTDTATITLGKRLVTVTAADSSKVSGQPDPAFTGYSITSGTLYLTDSITSVTASRANSGSNTVGSDVITISAVTFSPTNRSDSYTVTLATGTFTITAAATYTVTFNSDTATASTYTQSANTSTNSTANTFTRTGYTFGGWAASSGSKVVAYANQAPYAFTSSTTLYAIWNAVTYTITYDTNTATSGSIPSSQSFTLDSVTVTLRTNSGNLSLSGSTFVGWNENSGGSGTTYNASDPLTISAKNYTLYAIFSSDPTATTDTPTAITSTSFVLNGKANPKGNGGGQGQFKYGTDNTLTSASTTTAQSISGNSDVTLDSVTANSLTPATIYYYRTVGKATGRSDGLGSIKSVLT